MTAPLPGPPPASRPGGLRPDAGADPSVAVTLAMAGLEGLDGRPLVEHVEAFERVHSALGDALAAGSTG